MDKIIQEYIDASFKFYIKECRGYVVVGKYVIADFTVRHGLWVSDVTKVFESKYNYEKAIKRGWYIE